MQLLEKEGVETDPEQPSAQAVLEWKIRSMKDLLQLFYLTGKVSRFVCVLLAVVLGCEFRFWKACDHLSPSEGNEVVTQPAGARC